MLCNKCETELPDSSKFCHECGSPAPDPQLETIKFEGVANRSVIQQIGTINVAWMNEEQITAITEQFSRLLDGLGVTDHVSPEATPLPLPEDVQEVAQAVGLKVQEAERGFGRTVGYPGVYLRLGNAAYGNRDYEESLRYYGKALVIDPEGAETWRLRGVVLQRLVRRQEALENFERALEFDSESAETWRLRSYALDRLKRYEDALESVDKSLAIDPESTSAWVRRGATLRRLERPEEALESFDRALAIDANNFMAWGLLGGVLRELGREKEAAECYKKSQELAQNWAGQKRAAGDNIVS